MPKRIMIGAHKPNGHGAKPGGMTPYSTRNILKTIYDKEVQREIYLAAKRVQARPMRALRKPEPEPAAAPAPVLAPIIPLPATAPVPPQPMSRQQRWMQRQLKAGKCRRCGATRNLYAQFCDSCMGKVRDHRAKVGNKDRPGRPLKK